MNLFESLNLGLYQNKFSKTLFNLACQIRKKIVHSSHENYSIRLFLQVLQLLKKHTIKKNKKKLSDQFFGKPEIAMKFVKTVSLS